MPAHLTLEKVAAARGNPWQATTFRATLSPVSELPPEGICYVVVCRGPNCRERGALPLRARLVALLRGHPTVRLAGYNCFGQCERGPNVAFYPAGAWFGGLEGAEDARWVVEHAERPIEQGRAPLDLPEDERRAHLRNIAELVATLERDRRASSAREWLWSGLARRLRAAGFPRLRAIPRGAPVPAPRPGKKRPPGGGKP